MSQPPFFIAGDVLPADTPSYVTRPADHDLSASVLDGAFCYVLTARQMGKSSLMVRTASHLRERGVKVALVDLRTVTPASAGDWYLDLLVRLQADLRLRTDARAWWRARTGLGAPQRFIDFLHDVVLKEIAGNIVLFIDEIDAMLALDFRDDFFAAIRATYNARASDPAYKRLTFVLLGVATPTDLIKDLKRTPFNIGRAIELQEFSYADAAPLREGLEQRYPGQADRILTRIFYWTNGHPYLTQKLCLAAAETRNVTSWDDAQVDALVTASFFGPAADSDANFTFVRNKVLGAPEGERRQMLELYRAVYDGQHIADDESSPVQNHLELYGLVRVEKGTLVEKGMLAVRNEIYRHVFDRKWIEKHAPLSSETPAIFRNPTLLFALIAVLVAISGGGYALVRGQSNTTAATQTAIAAAQATGTAEQIIITTTTVEVPPSPTFAPPRPTAETPTALPATETPTAIPATETPTAIPATETSTAIPATETPTETPPILVISCQARSPVNLRTGPGNNFPKITDVALKQGETVTALGIGGETVNDLWIAIRTQGGRVGWVYNSFVSCSVDITDLSKYLPPYLTR